MSRDWRVLYKMKRSWAPLLACSLLISRLPMNHSIFDNAGKLGWNSRALPVEQGSLAIY
jgi:hypothetical protein